MAKLNETVYFESAPSVNAEQGLLKGVKLIGLESRNNRRYKREALDKAVAKYEGRKIYVDHPSRDNADGDRSFKDWAGTIQSARMESDGIYGDVKLRKTSPYFEGIIEAAREFPRDVGFSHVADGEAKLEGDTEIVESIREVFSVDLVTDPATTHGFFESKRPKAKTVKAAIESLPESTVRTKLVEMIDGGYIDGGMTMPEDEKSSDPVAQMSSLVKELIAMLGQALNTLAAKKDTPPPAPPAPQAPEDDMNNDPTKQPPAEDPAKAKADAEAFEKLKQEKAELNAKCLLLESGREATAVRIKALAAAPEADRKDLLESWPMVESVDRPLRSPALIESESADLNGYEFSDPEKFAARYR